MEGEGFEPSKAEPSDLQSDPLTAREPLKMHAIFVEDFKLVQAMTLSYFWRQKRIRGYGLPMVMGTGR